MSLGHCIFYPQRNKVKVMCIITVKQTFFDPDRQNRISFYSLRSYLDLYKTYTHHRNRSRKLVL